MILHTLMVAREEEPADERRPLRLAPPPADYARRYAQARGAYRIFNPAVYRFYRSNAGAPADAHAGGTPYATAATLPATPANTFADGTWTIGVSWFNGILDSGFLRVGPHGERYRTLTIAGGVLQPAAPAPPAAPALQVRAGGVVRIVAQYFGLADMLANTPANQWAIAYTTDGTTPAAGSPTITPTLYPARPGAPVPACAVLSYDLPAQADGTPVKVQLQTRRVLAGPVYAYSPAGTVLAAVARTTGPGGPMG